MRRFRSIHCVFAVLLATAAGARATDGGTKAPTRAEDAAAPAEPAGQPAEPQKPPADVVKEHGGLALQYQFEVEGQSAQGKLYRNASGDVRLDLRMREPQTRAPIKTSVIVLGGDPDTAFHIVHTTRQFGRVPLPPAASGQAERYVVEELEGEKLHGFATRHVKLTDSKSGDEFELWLAPAAGDLSLVDRALRSIQPYQGSLRQALVGRKIDGLPVRLVYKKRSNGAVTRGEVTDVTLGPVEGDRFAPPRGYSSTTMKTLNPLEAAGGPMKNVKKLFKGFRR